MLKSTSDTYPLFFAVLAAVFFIPFIGNVHLFDWDEINFAEIAREMVVLGEYLSVHVNFVSFTEKPPFFFWLQAAAMNVFGVGEFAARLPNAILGIITLPIIYNMGKRLFNSQFGFIWAFTYFGTVLPNLYFRSGLIDPYFNFFIFLGLYYLILASWKKAEITDIELNKSKNYYLVLGGIIIGLGILTKGPVAFLFILLTGGIYWLLKRFKMFISVGDFILFSLSALIMTGLWYGLETLINGPQFVIEFTMRQLTLLNSADAGQSGFPGYHFVVLLVGCFPASVFMIRGMMKLEHQHTHQKDFRLWMIILFWAVLILFSIVKSKIVHYSSLAYFPLTFLAAYTIYYIVQNKIRFAAWMKTMLIGIVIIVAGAFITLTVLGQDIESLKPLFEKDKFALANLDAQVNWPITAIIPGILLLISTLLGMLWLTKEGKKSLGFKVLFGGTALFVQLTLFFFIGRVEHYSQRAAIEFCESKQTEDCYVITKGYRSYAHYFYTRTEQRPLENERFVKHLEEYKKNVDTDSDAARRHEVFSLAWSDWILNGDIDKNAYIITKINKADYLRGREDMEELYAKNGFVFFKRSPVVR